MEKNISSTNYTITPEFEKLYYDVLYPYIVPLIFVTIIIVWLNGLILYIFFVDRKSIKTPEKYIISMTCGDFFIGMSNIIVGFQLFYIPAILDPYICYVLNPLGYLRHTISVVSLMITTIDRYHCTAFPHHYHTNVDSRKVNSKFIESSLKVHLSFYFT